jgi:hypothetical protein
LAETEGGVGEAAEPHPATAKTMVAATTKARRAVIFGIEVPSRRLPGGGISARIWRESIG